MVLHLLHSLRNKTEIFIVLKHFASLTKQKLICLFCEKFLGDDISDLRSYYADRCFYETDDLLKKLL